MLRRRAWLVAFVATAYSAPSADGKWSVALTPEDTGVPWSRLPQRAASANESAEEHDPKGTPDRMADGQKEAARERELAKQRRADRMQDRAAKAKQAQEREAQKQRERQQQQQAQQQPQAQQAQ